LNNLKTDLQEAMAHVSRFRKANVDVEAECKTGVRMLEPERLLSMSNHKIEVTYTLTANPGKIKLAQKIIESKESLKEKMEKASKKQGFQVENTEDPKVSEVKKKCDSGYFLDEFLLVCQNCLSNCSSCKDFDTCDKCAEGFKLVSNRCISEDENPNNSSSLKIFGTFIGIIIIIH
jgi:hypothetical protein